MSGHDQLLQICNTSKPTLSVSDNKRKISLAALWVNFVPKFGNHQKVVSYYHNHSLHQIWWKLTKPYKRLRRIKFPSTSIFGKFTKPFKLFTENLPPVDSNKDRNPTTDKSTSPDRANQGQFPTENNPHIL